MCKFADGGPSARNVSALAQELDAIPIGVFDKMVIKNLATVRTRSDLPSTLTLCFHRRAVHQPIDDVQVVNVLFANVVPTQPIKVVPVVDLILKLGLIWCSVASPNSIVVPVGSCKHNVANRPIFELCDGCLIARFVVSLQSDRDHQILFLSDLIRCQHASHARSVRSHRLFHKHMLSCLDGGFEVHWSEPWRCRKNDHVDVGLKESLVTIDPDKNPVGYINVLTMFLIHRPQRIVDLRLEWICHCSQLQTILGRNGV